MPVMIAVAFACLPIFFTGGRINRWEGALFLFYFIAYTAWLVMNSAGSPSLTLLNSAMLSFVLPLTAITLALIVARTLRGPRGVDAGQRGS
jgi:cation:H+ antiporter